MPTEGESVEDFADRLYALALEAYPGADMSLAEEVAIEQFFLGYRDRRSAVLLSMNRQPKTLAEAVQVFKEMRYCESVVGPKGSAALKQVSFEDVGEVDYRHNPPNARLHSSLAENRYAIQALGQHPSPATPPCGSTPDRIQILEDLVRKLSEQVQSLEAKVDGLTMG